MNRRPFLKLGGLTFLSVGAGTQRIFADEVDAAALYAKYVPLDKELHPNWLASLTTRHAPLDASIQHRKSQRNLDVIGMPVGGIACGTVYLAGDGRLWVWDIFNQHHEGVVANNRAKAPEGLKDRKGRTRVPESKGANFVLPPRAGDHANGVDARFTFNDGKNELPLDASGWDDVSFTGRWPIGRVDYASEKTALKVRLEAYSPFVPLDLKASSLPVTVLEYSLSNPSDQAATVTLTGQLNNPAGQFSGRESDRLTEDLGAGLPGIYHGLKGGQKALDAGSMAMAALDAGDAAVDLEQNTIAQAVRVPSQGTKTLRFAISWHFPNLNEKIGKQDKRRHYANDFADARAVMAHYAQDHERLSTLTHKWVDTWNDSTLPQWLLDRTILTANTLQTQNCLIFEHGRFWAWEGIGCCHGTCGHVWHYAQGHARLFPEIERNLREVTDYGLAQKADGAIKFRGTNPSSHAIDAQCGYVLRTLRDHQLSDDPAYLRRVWEPARKAIRFLVDFDRQDPRGGLDGLLDGKQHNTLDANWYGKVHVLCSLYLAALRAGEEMALGMGDDALAGELREVYAMGAQNIEQLYNGEFYEQIEDPQHLDAIGVGKGCYIDQVMGQFWANQLGLGRLYRASHQKSALRALWKYNFVPDYGSFRQGFTRGRHYATRGDSGLLMCTWPKGGLRNDFKQHWQYGYFNEFMTGFEYQAAAHMIAERDDDLVRQGLAITRAIHDRYAADRGRNPYNEIECSDHYARAGSSYAVFLALCGFHFDQSKGLLRFDPVIQKNDFKTPFTTSTAWGTYAQTAAGASIRITHGSLRIQTLELPAFAGGSLRMTLNGHAAPEGELELAEGDNLELYKV